MGKHAGGIVIAAVDLTETIPLVTRRNPETKQMDVLSSFAEGQNRSDLKTVGLVKQDILGLENLNYIDTCLKFMQARGKYDPDIGIFKSKPDLENWTDESYFNDPESLKAADAGDLTLVFQFDSPGIRNLVYQGGVAAFEDLVAYTSLYRPGPLNSGMASEYVLRKRYKEADSDAEKQVVIKGKYKLHPLLEPIIGNTFGVIIYQEQLMKVMNAVGMFSLQECDDIRRAMTKKKIEEFEKFYPRFIENGHQTLGWPKTTAAVEDEIKNSPAWEIIRNKIRDKYRNNEQGKKIYKQLQEEKLEYIETIDGLWNQMITFAKYGFNKSHALSYTIISLRCLYLKVHYPIEYWAAVLSHLKTGDPRINLYISEGKKKGLKFIPCDINRSKMGFTIDNEEIVFGFDKLKGVGKSAQDIIDLQPYNSFEEFLDRFGYGKKVCETLIKLGVFNRFYSNCAKLLKYYEYKKEKNSKEFGMAQRDFGKMYKELTESKSCPRDMTDKFKELLGEGCKKIPYIKLVQLNLQNKFDFIGINKDQTSQYIECHREEFHESLLSYNDIENCADWSAKEKTDFEKEYYSVYFEHPLSKSRRKGHTIAYARERGIAEGIIEKIETRIAKNDNEYYIITIEDENDKLSLLLWNNQYTMWKNEEGTENQLLQVGQLVEVRVRPPVGHYSTWNLPKVMSQGMPLIKRIRMLDEPSEEEERMMNSELNFEESINEIIRSNDE